MVIMNTKKKAGVSFLCCSDFTITQSVWCGLINRQQADCGKGQDYATGDVDA